MNCSPNWRARRARPTSPNCATSAPAPRSARPRKSPTANRARISRRSSRCSSRFRATSKAALRTTRPFVKDAGFLKAEIKAGQFFILGGQTAYVAEVGEPFKAPNGESDARLRVIYSNGTESNLLLRSLQRALYKDEAAGASPIRSPDRCSPIRSEDGDQASGTIYVLRSKSDHPIVAAHRDILHKIGVTGGERRTAHRQCAPRPDLPHGGRRDRRDLRTLQHQPDEARKPDPSRLRPGPPRYRNQGSLRQAGHPDANGSWCRSSSIDEAVERIKDGTITGYVYDPKTAKLALASALDR